MWVASGPALEGASNRAGILTAARLAEHRARFYGEAELHALRSGRLVLVARVDAGGRVYRCRDSPTS